MTMHRATRDRRRQRGLLDDRLRCSRCDAINDRSPHRYCRACHAATMRDWRARHVFVSRETVCTTQEERR
jgi:hypothetical protein